MTAPRCILPGEVRFSTYRTADRCFIFKPDVEGKVAQLYWYFTAVLANEYGLSFHAAQLLSNHLHEVVTDNLGLYPSFATQRNRLLANAIKVLRKIPGQIFERSGGSSIAVRGSEAILRQIGYTLANVVSAGLVDSPEDWPGATVLATDLGTRVVRVKRPDIYIDKKNPRWPEEAELEITMPQRLVDDFGLDAAKERVVSAVASAVERGRAALREAGRSVLGIAGVLATSFSARASSYEERGTRNPTFAAAGNKEEAVRAIREQRAFRSAYRAALEAARAGVDDVVFPFGSWRVHRSLGFPVQAREAPTFVFEQAGRCPSEAPDALCGRREPHIVSRMAPSTSSWGACAREDRGSVAPRPLAHSTIVFPAPRLRPEGASGMT